ncbi:hypothetical protein PGT21_012744 [Puccinia graminis f. sp. tritici]|uniref:RING-type domain-containing protein n=2 Tax=Puccinia graminis f. sp. tritici TaxID=56615 RepID=E3JYI9_PUCGT|nr:uncharacterized protein PGTG_03070 [Puccinia graminis f. sp. tritici CRL 75-36-700-3]EFP77114.1 hypothetical protein PGTG_03070 [Puccinia graminis f. sp. tritici CRL 75-36-700-3]KAA1097163.1 hypothetical protein PGTUg99_000219 [Puccinia graminis f. sp. tritici]KAA1105592.1 hypothetical protein PGT21_012744 [Puccinia graminis f. sp. tritici]KAA1118278.1 hypothetical protein PGTUg99_001174 [Puccinia graminis f. sp. tritici]
MFLYLTHLLFFQQAYQSSARRIVDPRGELDGLKPPSNSNAISASTVTIPSGPAAPLSAPSTFRRHSKRLVPTEAATEAAAEASEGPPTCAICLEELTPRQPMANPPKGKKLFGISIPLFRSRSRKLPPVQAVSGWPCAHVFHQSCKDGWTNLGHQECPSCRMLPDGSFAGSHSLPPRIPNNNSGMLGGQANGPEYAGQAYWYGQASGPEFRESSGYEFEGHADMPELSEPAYPSHGHNIMSEAQGHVDRTDWQSMPNWQQLIPIMQSLPAAPPIPPPWYQMPASQPPYHAPQSINYYPMEEYLQPYYGYEPQFSLYQMAQEWQRSLSDAGYLEIFYFLLFTIFYVAFKG